MFPSSSRLAVAALAALLLLAGGAFAYDQSNPSQPNAERERQERESREREEQQQRARQEQENRARQEGEQRFRREQEFRLQQEQEFRARQEQERREREEQELRSQQDRALRARQENEQRMNQERERRASEERQLQEGREQERRAAEPPPREERRREGRGRGLPVAPPFVDYAAPGVTCEGGEITFRGDCSNETHVLICYGNDDTANFAEFSLRRGETRIVTTPPNSTFSLRCDALPPLVCPARNCVNPTTP